MIQEPAKPARRRPDLSVKQMAMRRLGCGASRLSINDDSVTDRRLLTGVDRPDENSVTRPDDGRLHGDSTENPDQKKWNA